MNVSSIEIINMFRDFIKENDRSMISLISATWTIFFKSRKKTYKNNFNPIKTDKTGANSNFRLCLKWKPQAKCC